MATIGRLVYKIQADTGNFTKEMGLTRQEIRAAKTIFEQSKDPIEKYQEAVRNLDALAKKANLSQKQYDFALDKIKAQYGQVTPAAKGFTAALRQQVPIIDQLSNGTVAASVAVGSSIAIFHKWRAAVVDTARTFNEYATELDATIKKARELELSFGFLKAIRENAIDAGVPLEALERAVSKMVLRVRQAATGNKEFAKAFETLNLNAAELVKLSPEEQFVAIGRALREVDAATRDAAAVKILEESFREVLPVLLQSDEAMQGLIGSASQWNELATEESKAATEQYTHNMAQLTRSVDLFTTALTLRAAPAAAEFVEQLSGLLTGENIAGGLDAVTDTVNVFAANLGGVEALLSRYWFATTEAADATEQYRKQQEQVIALEAAKHLEQTTKAIEEQTRAMMEQLETRAKLNGEAETAAAFQADLIALYEQGRLTWQQVLDLQAEFAANQREAAEANKEVAKSEELIADSQKEQIKATNAHKENSRLQKEIADNLHDQLRAMEEIENFNKGSQALIVGSAEAFSALQRRQRAGEQAVPARGVIVDDAAVKKILEGILRNTDPNKIPDAIIEEVPQLA